MFRRVTSVLVLATCVLLGHPLWAAMGEQSVPGAPTVLSAIAVSRDDPDPSQYGVSVAVVPPSGTLLGYHVEAIPLRGASMTTVQSSLLTPDGVSGRLEMLTGLTVGTTYQARVRAVSSGGNGAWSSLSNTFTVTTTTVPYVDPTVTYVLPSWAGLIRGTGTASGLATSYTVTQMAQRLRTDIGQGPKAKIGLSVFVQITMPNWDVDINDPGAMHTALASARSSVDSALANAQAVRVATGQVLPIGISLITAIRERVDGVETSASSEDHRNIQWYTDQTRATGWMTFSQYARKMRRVKEAYIRSFGRYLAERMAQYPEALVAVTGDGEIEMASTRFKLQNDPANAATRSWADYSPFAQAEFRDWLRGTGMYAVGQPLAGQAFSRAANFTTDPTPNSKGTGATGPTFNQYFQTNFTTWELKHHNWSLTDGETAGAITSATGSATACPDGQNLGTDGYCFIVGGFDAPRPDPVTILTRRNDIFWDAFRTFREQMVHRYNRDFAQWITEGTAVISDPLLAGLRQTARAGVPYDRFYSAQVPTDLLFRQPAADGGVRLLTSGSPHWTANIWPFGGMGVTGYNANAHADPQNSGVSGNSGGFYDRTVENVAPKVAALARRWSIVEWNPSDPWSQCPDIYRADNLVVRQYRPSLLMPYKIETTNSELQRVFDSGFATGLKELMTGVTASTATPNCGRPQTEPLVDAPGIAQPSGQARGGWAPIITWANPAPILAGVALSETQLNATANIPGTFSYSPASGATLVAGTRTLTATFTPTDPDYAQTTTTVSILVREAPGSISGRVTAAAGGANLEGVRVEAFTSLGSLAVARTTTAADGTFTLGSLRPGDYAIRFHKSNFVDELYRSDDTNVHCSYHDYDYPRNCDSGFTRIYVSDDSRATNVTGINEALDEAAQLEVTVLIGNGTTPAANALVRFSDKPAEKTTGSDGTVVFDSGSTIDSIRPGVGHPLTILPSGGWYPADRPDKALVLTPGLNRVTRRVFPASYVSGTVRGGPGVMLSGVTIEAYGRDGVKVLSETSGSGGEYTVRLPAGTYYLKAVPPPSSGYAPQLYETLPCENCSPIAGRAVTVDATVPTTGVNFDLVQGRTISGTVTDASFTPLSGIVVELLDSGGTLVRSTAPTGANGQYSIGGLTDGTYWVRTRNSRRYVDRIYQSGIPGGTDCVKCGTATGSPITIASGTGRSGVDFVLTPGGSIIGTVSAASGPLGGATVELYSASDTLLETVAADDNGIYRTTLGLPNANYFVVAKAKDYNTEVWDDRGCPACTPSSTGVAITVTSDAMHVRKDFTLIQGSRVSGRVTSTSAPSTGIVTTVAILELTSPHREVTRARTGPDGSYETDIVPLGSYYAVALGTSTHQRQFFCSATYGGCPTGPGVPFGVGSTSTTGIDIRMAPGASISGTVTVGGVSLPGRTIEVFDSASASVPIATVRAEVDGTYETPAFDTGKYFLRVKSGQGYVGQIYDGVSDVGQAPQSGKSVSVTTGTPVTGINFALVAGGRITGRVTDGASAVGNATVQIFTDAGGDTPIAEATTLENGSYTTESVLPAGTYYAVARARGFLPELYEERTCVGCRPQSGRQITVASGAATENINFTLSTGGGLSGSVTANGVAASGVTVEIYAAAQPTVTPVATATTDAMGRWATDGGLTAGARYYVRTRNTRGLIDRLFPAVECEPCTLSSGTSTAVISGEVTDIGTIALVSGGSITGRVTRTSTGLAVENITVEVYRSGTPSPVPQVLTTNDSGVYATQAGLIAGDYFVRTFSRGRILGLVDEVYNNVECAPCVPREAGTAIAVASSAVTGIDFSLAERTASIAGVTRTGGNTISGITVRARNAAGTEIGSAVSDSTGNYRITGLAAGSYYLEGNSGWGTFYAWYDGPTGATRIQDATAVVVADAEAKTGIDIVDSASDSTVSLELSLKVTFAVTLSKEDEAYCALFLNGITESLGLSSGTWDVSAGCTVVDVDSSRRLGARSNTLGTFTVTPGQQTRVVLDAPTCSALPTFSTTAIANGKVGNAYSQTLAATGGTGAVSYVLADSFLAPGLSLNASTGAITGTPTGAGASVFTVAASDVNGCTSTQDFSMNVAAADPVNGTATPASLSFSATKSGSTGPLTNLTPAQNVALTFATGVAPAWTATSNQPWLQVSTASGTGPATLAVSISDPTNTIGLSTSLSGTITIAGTGIANGPLTISVSLSVSQLGPVNGTVTPAALRFGATKDGASGAVTSVTPAQSVALTFATGGVPSWTATSDQPWLQVGTASGTGPASLTISVSNPSNVIGASTSLSGNITITGASIANGPLTIPVTLTVDQTNGATPSLPFGQVDTPAQNATGVQGAIGVTGWVLDNVGVSSVKIYRNCLSFDNPASCQSVLGNSMVFVGDAAFLAGARSDVEGAFTTTPQANRAGWGYLMLTSMLPHVTSELPNGGVGPLTIYAVATDAEGNQRLLGRSADPAAPDFTTPTSITMANDTIAKPFGAIDTPGQGATVSGVLNNFGWALTPDSNTTGSEVGDILIPTNGTTMTVFIDSVPVAQVAYNQCRGSVGNPVPAGVFCNDDVSSIFGHATPQASLTARSSNPTRYRNLDAQRAAIGVYSFDTTGLSNGLHTIAWSVTDSASRTEGIGSRFFNVLNSGSGSDQALRDRPAAVRGWASMLSGRTPGTVGVWGRTGFDLAADWVEMSADAAGTFRVRLPEAGRLELWLGTPVDAGYLVAEDGSLRDLPVGSRLDGASFGWMPPVGYVGRYHLAFVRGNERVDVHVTITAAAPVSADVSEIRMHLDPVRVDADGAALNERSVLVEGWAFDPKAAIESGIGAVHVWARRLDVGAAGDTPTFLGVADLNVERLDVAQSVNGAPGRAGFRFDARLATGTWELTAYVWNVRTGRFEDARSVATIVR